MDIGIINCFKGFIKKFQYFIFDYAKDLPSISVKKSRVDASMAFIANKFVPDSDIALYIFIFTTFENILNLRCLLLYNSAVRKKTSLN